MQVGAATVVKVGDQWVVQMGSIPTVPLPTSTAPNPNLAHIVRPEDTPILEAYVKYITAIHQAYSRNPIDADPATLFENLVTKGKYRTIKENLARRRDAGSTLNVTGGVTIRPFVLSDPRTASEATVWDCQRDGSFFFDAATGVPAAGENPGVKQYGTAALVVLLDGVWVVDITEAKSGACLPE